MLKKILLCIFCLNLLTSNIPAQEIIKNPYSVFQKLCPNVDQLSEEQLSDESLSYSELLNACGIPTSLPNDHINVELNNSFTDVTKETLNLDAKTARKYGSSILKIGTLEKY